MLLLTPVSCLQLGDQDWSFSKMQRVTNMDRRKAYPAQPQWGVETSDCKAYLPCTLLHWKDDSGCTDDISMIELTLLAPHALHMVPF